MILYVVCITLHFAIIKKITLSKVDSCNKVLNHLEISDF